MRRVAWVVALIGACAGAKPRVHKPGQEYLVAIRIDGATAIDPDDLIPRLGLYRNVQSQLSLDDYQLSLDTTRIAAVFQKRGFLGVEVKSRIEKRSGDAATLVFTIVEGKRARTHVELSGLPQDVEEAKARALIPIAEGAPFDYDAFDAAKDPLLELLEESGYAHARILANVFADRSHATATMRFVIDPGPVSRFGKITLLGADGRLAEAVRERIAFSEGDRFTRSAIVRTKAAIYGIGLFTSARVEPDQETTDAVVPVKIAVTPVTKNELSLGGGLGLDPISYSIRGRAQWVRHGVITPLTTSNLDLRPSYAFETARCTRWYLPWSCTSNDGHGPGDFRGRAIETLTQQDFLWTDVKGDVEGGIDYLIYEAYAKLGAHVRLGLAKTFVEKLQVRVGWRYEAVDFTSTYIDAVDAKALALDRVNYIGAYTAAVQLDLRDRPIEPTRGLFAAVHVAKGTRFALGGFEYLQVTPEVRLFWPLGPLVVAVRGRLGTITGDVPATERYYGGGVSSMRGFGQRGLSPRALAASWPSTPQTIASSELIVIGGAGLVETSAEVRVPLGKPKGVDLGGVVFVDGGDVKNTIGELDLSNQYWAIGFGLRWLSPIGAIGADLGYRLNRLLPGESHYNPMFAIGEAF